MALVLVVASAAAGVIVVGPRLIRMQGHSMSPTLRDDDRALFLRLRGAPARGDIVALRYPKNPAKSFAMRVVGLPGDELTIADGVVRIGGRPLAEPYVPGASRSHENVGPIRLGVDEYFVMGDRRNNASDSREWGPVSRHLIWARFHSVLVRPGADAGRP